MYCTVLKYNLEVRVLYLSISIVCYGVLLLHYRSEVKCVLFIHYMFLIPLVTSQMNDVKYNQVLNQTLVPPGVNSQVEVPECRNTLLQ